MTLTLSEAATRLGKSRRQVRYLIQTGHLPAKKAGGHWVIEESDLPLSDGQRARQRARAAELQAAVDDALQPVVRPAKTYSVRGVRPFEAAVAAARSAHKLLGEHRATARIEDCALALSRGAHTFHHGEKRDAYAHARIAAAEAVALLFLEGNPAADTMLAR